MSRFAEVARQGLKTGRKVAGRVKADLRTRLNTNQQSADSAKPVQDKRRPELSVVVPAYGVERYLAECLDSLLAQEAVRIEVIVVDDGSPDRSGEIADEYAQRDPRVRVVHKTNGGLGAARNTGIAVATGKYITFVDSDDVVPQGAYKRMLDTLRASGSDFVVGAIERMQGDRRWTPQWAKRVHAVDQIGITLDQHPEILKSVFACNKVFNTDFFRAAVGSFPENIRYEDQLPAAQAYSAANKFDVIHDVVYTWLIRDDGSSITQQKQNIEDLKDRLDVIHSVTRYLEELDRPEILQHWLGKAVGFDLRPYVEQVPRVALDYVEVLKDGLKSLLSKLSRAEWERLDPSDRLLVHATVHGTQAEVELLLAQRQEYGWSMSATPNPGGLSLEVDGLETLSFEVPSDLLDVRWRDVSAKAVLDGYSLDHHNIVVKGFAYVQHLDTSRFPLRLQVVVSDGNGDEYRPQTDQNPDPLLDDYSPEAYASRAGGRFTTVIDPSELARLNGSLLVRVEITQGAYSTTQNFTHRSNHGSGWAFPVADAEHRFMAEFDTVDGLTLRAVKATYSVDSVRIDGATVSLEGIGGNPSELLLKSARGEVPIHWAQDQTGAQFSVPEEMDDPRREWRLMARRSDGALRVVHFTGSSQKLSDECPPTNGLSARLTVSGAVRVGRGMTSVEVDSVDVGSDSLTLRGRAVGLTGPVALERNGSLWSPTKWSSDGVAWRADFSLVTELGTARPKGAYQLVSVSDNGGLARSSVAPQLRGQLMHVSITDNSRVRVSRVVSTGALRLEVLPRIEIGELGRHAIRQRRLAQRNNPLPPTEDMLFESFGGRSNADAPAELARIASERAAGGKLYWAVDHLSTPAPQGTRPVVVGSSEYFRVLHSARYLFNNNNFPYYFDQQSFQTYVQTWHGTPLKRIGNDVPSASLSFSYRRLMRREAAGWTYLLSQNEYSTQIFPGAFGFDGTVLTLGYPRNDDLFRDPEARRQQVRARLGLDDSDHVLLYAPTWRDQTKTASGGYALVNYLDVARLRQEFGESFKVLVRGHVNTIADAAGEIPGVVNVSAYPDVNDLMVAADCMVTDYSSIMFDFAVTRKPFYLLTPDLDNYGESTRGFYADPSEIAPFGVAMDMDQLVAQLKQVPSSDVRNRYDRFVERFCSADDGSAGERVANVIWGRA